MPEKVQNMVDAVQEGQKILLSRGIPNGLFQIIFAPPTRFDLPSSDTSVHPTWYESWWHVIYAGLSYLTLISGDQMCCFNTD